MEKSTTGPLFDNFADIFEASVNWPKRLAHEGPFYREHFGRLGVKSVLDAACGPGHHVGMFHGWGLKVQGADVSPAMIARARGNFGEREGLEWRLRGYDEDPGAAFDAVICVGNSLALAGNAAAAERAVGRMMAAAGKVLVIHVANMAAWPEGPCVWQKCLRVALAEGPATCLKGVHRVGTRAFIELLVIADGAVPKLRNQSVGLMVLEAGELEAWGRAAGARRMTVFGGYGGDPYERGSSVDLIMVAER